MRPTEVKKFATGYNLFTVIFLVIVLIGIWIPVFIYPHEAVPVLAINILVSALVLWILLGTYYFISNAHLYYRCGPFRGKINIMNIRKVEHDNHFIKTSLMKLGLSRKGFKIYYDKFDDIYLSPKDKESFLEVLLSINPNIIVIDTKK